MEETDEIPDSHCVSCNVGEPACFEPGTFMRETESAAQDEAETRNPVPGPVISGGVPLPYGLAPIVSPCPCGACGERRDRSLGQSDWWALREVWFECDHGGGALGAHRAFR